MLHAKDEEKAKAAEFEQAGKKFEEEGSDEAAGRRRRRRKPAAPSLNRKRPRRAPAARCSWRPTPTEIAYDTTSLTSKPGKVTIDFTNPSALEHDVAIEAESGKEIATSPLIAKGKTSVSADLAPGTYHFYCTVPGHRRSGHGRHARSQVAPGSLTSPP